MELNFLVARDNTSVTKNIWMLQNTQLKGYTSFCTFAVTASTGEPAGSWWVRLGGGEEAQRYTLLGSGADLNHSLSQDNPLASLKTLSIRNKFCCDWVCWRANLGKETCYQWQENNLILFQMYFKTNVLLCIPCWPQTELLVLASLR